MDRRAFLGTVAGGLFAAPLAAGAQPGVRIPRIAVLGLTPIADPLRGALKQGLGESGYTEGQNVAIEYRDAGGRPERLAEIADDLVRPNVVHLVFARGAGTVAAAKRASSRIPIVAVDLESDPVATGFVRSLAAPGGNITGVFLDLPEVSAKQLQMLKEIIRSLPRVAILGDPLLNAPQFQATEVAARALTIQPQVLHLRSSEEIDAALEGASRGRASAILLLSSPLVFHHRMALGQLTAKRRLPAISMFPEFAQAGGLIAYGPSLVEAFRLAGARAGQILRGANPGDLPIERPTKFELVINLKTAKALGLTIPQSLLQRADQVIE